MLIFKKWFEDHAKENPWTNLTKFGAKLEGILHSEFSKVFPDGKEEVEKQKILVDAVRQKIQSKLKEDSSFFKRTNWFQK